LTLKFLGNIEPQRIPEIREALETVSTSTSPFKVALEGAGVFPNWNRPRVIWVGLRDPEKGLSTLHTRIDEALIPLGFEKEARTFSPHLTLARIKSAKGSKQLKTEMEALQPVRSDTFEIMAVTLYQSELISSGSRYTVLDRQTLCSRTGDPSSN